MIKADTDKFINDLNKIFSQAADDISSKAGMAARKAGFDLYKQFIGGTPVGEKKGGTARQGWQAPDITSTRDLTMILIRNPILYTSVLDEGSLLGKRPWPTAKKRTSVSKGHVYSKQAVGGITGPIANENEIEKIAQQIKDAVLK